MNEIIAGKRGITPETARELGAALGTSAEFWMNLDAPYQLWKAGPAPQRIAHKARLRSHYPIREMVRRGWIEASEDPDVMETRLLRFFEIKSLEEQPRLAYAAKQKAYSQPLSPVQCAWLYRVKHIAQAMQIGTYSSKALRNALQQMEGFRGAPEAVRYIPRLLADYGVRFVIVEQLPSSKIDGVCLWLGPNAPVIGMSLRFDRIDNFWFVLRHEIEHVLRRDGKDSAVVDSDLHLPDEA